MTQEIFRSICLSFMHQPYRWGGANPIDGFDCSGLVQEILATFGKDPKGDQTAQALYDWAKSLTQGQKNDSGFPIKLHFFGQDTSKISHVGIGFDIGLMIEAGGGDSKTLSLIDARLKRAFVRIRPVTSRRDLVASINV